MKRVVDVVGGATLLAVTLPILGVVAALIRYRLGRPVLFRQVRSGLRGNPFTLVKFRTMRPAKFEGEPDHHRITRLGDFLRRTSLDELPTFWNVVKGDMSLVGPRPLPMEYLERYTPEQARRHDVRPGITGLAQVSGRNAVTWEERLALDVWYVDHSSLPLDLKILIRTVGVVLKRQGVTAHGHATMPKFLGEDSSDHNA